MLVYLDTNGWTKLDEWIGLHGTSLLRDHEFLFSSCVLDEISVAEGIRAQNIARTAYRVSNRRKLQDHLELSRNEIICYQTGQNIESYYDDLDTSFFVAWDVLRKRGLTAEFLQRLRESHVNIKGSFKSHLKQLRKNFKVLSEREPIVDWSIMMNGLEQRKEIGHYIYSTLLEWSMLGGIPKPEEIEAIPLESIPSTACWVQYYIALSYFSVFKTGKQTKPDLGDQVDFRHACYTGIADVYISDDRRMTAILEEYVYYKKALIMNLDEFIELCRNIR